MKKLLLVLSVCLLTASGLRAQHSPSARPGTGCPLFTLDTMSLFPTYHTDMNLTEFLGYAYFDSLCRSATRSQIDSLLRDVKSIDTLKYLLKYYYALQEYSAHALLQYRFAPLYSTNYTVPPSYVINAFERKARSILKNSTASRAALSPVIVHVRVKGEYSSEDSAAYLPKNPLPMRCVKLEILDTIKGRHLISSTCTEPIAPLTGEGIREYPCISVTYSPLWERNAELHESGAPVVVDSLGNIRCDSCYGNAFVVGGEYIVTLRPVYYYFDGQYDRFTYFPVLSYNHNGGIWQILGDNVIDPQNFWGLGTNTNLISFKTGLRAAINTIKNP
jgi:hypothetical protein